jgi:hypothetical protein
LPAAAAANARRHRPRAAAALAEPAARTSSDDPAVTQRLELRDPVTNTPIHVFGVDHRYSQPDIAAWVLRARPSAVVAETACTPQHGRAAATQLDTCPQQLGAPGASAFFLRMFVQVAAALKQQLLDSGMRNMRERGMGSAQAYEEAVRAALDGGRDGAHEGNGGASLWQQATQNFNGEQLAYVAGLAVGAPVLFGDRPKGLTYRRLWDALSNEDLDAAFEDERVREALEELRGMAEEWRAKNKGALPASVASALAAAGDKGGIAPVRPDTSFQGVQSATNMNAAERIMYLEREAVMCAVLAVACSRAAERREAALEARRVAAEANGGRAAVGLEEDLDSSSTTPSPIAAVFGAAHLPGLKRLWESGEWRALLAAADASSTAADDPATLLASSPLLTAPAVDPSSITSPQAGTKRGLLEALLSNSVTEEVLADLDNHLQPIPPLPSPSEGFSSPEQVLEASMTAPHPATAARFWSREIYGTFRMRLAALPIEVLDGLVSAWPGEGAPRGDELPPEATSAWGLLAPLRALRPTYGGPGWDAAVGLQLRQLNYELGPPGGSGEGEDDSDAVSEASAATAVDGGVFFQDV